MGVLDGLTQGLKDMVGANQKAILEIADFSEREIEQEEAAGPNAGRGAIGGGTVANSGFNANAMRGFAEAAGVDTGNAEAFADFTDFRKFRFECQFNPEEISISGYGGEEIPTQTFALDPEGPPPAGPPGGDPRRRPERGSHMRSANTHIDLNFKLVFDKTNIQDAFYSDKFTLNWTSIGKGAVTGIKNAVTGKTYSVQPEVEALTAIVRDNNKRLAKFTWGDMSYQGVINTVNAEYVMFNVNCEPIRAYVTINMVLYDEDVKGANSELWAEEYMRDIYSIKDAGALGAMAGNFAENAADVAEGAQNMPGADQLNQLGDILGGIL